MLGASRSLQASATQGASVSLPVVQKSRLVAISIPACKKQPAFQPVRQSVKTRAAEVGAASSTPGRQGRSPRQAVTVQIAGLKPGDKFEGKVIGLESFGAFVDFGAGIDGLVHVSQMASGFVKKASDVVSIGDTVNVKLLSIDVAKNRVALTMKNVSQGEEEPEEEPEEEEEEEPEPMPSAAAADKDVPSLGSMIPDGYIPVASDMLGFEDIVAVAPRDLAEGMTPEEMYALEEEDFEVEYENTIPYLELVSGKVARVEEFGVFVDFVTGGKSYSGLLHASEMKAPVAKLEEAPEVEEGEQAEPYVALEDVRSNVAKYYATGDAVDALVLSFENGKVSLTQFMDWERDEGDDDDIMATSPAEELENMEIGADGEPLEAAVDQETMYNLNFVETEIRSGASVGLMTNKKGEFMALNFPRRDLSTESLLQVIAPLKTSEVDIDLDVMELNDVWSSEWDVPKNILKRTGAKIVVDEQGNQTFADRENAQPMSENALSNMLAAEGDLEGRINSLMADLLSDDVDEEELPVRAYRRPVAFAASVEAAAVPAKMVKELRNKTGAGMMDCKKALIECNGNVDTAMEWLRKKGLAGADKKAGRVAAEGALIAYIHPGSRLGVLVEVNSETDFVAAGDKFLSLANEVAMITAASPDVICVNPEDVPEEVLEKERAVEMGKEDIKSRPEAMRAKIVEGRLEKTRNSRSLVNQASLRDPSKTVKDIVKETVAAVGENIQIRRYVKFQLGEGLEKKSNDFAAEVAQQTAAKAEAPKPKAPEPVPQAAPAEPAAPAIQVSAAVVKILRDKTGAGMMDCKKALAANNADMDASIEWLRKKGLAGADKKMGRVAAEGAIAAYIHPGSRLGVMLEVNCETDFVAASDKFLSLVNGIAMQIAASPQVAYVSAEDIPAEIFEREKTIEMGREDLKSKPEAIRAKIAEGRTKKLVQEMALVDQPSLADGSKTIGDLVKEAIAGLGEKISVRRFVRFQLGEGLEKKSNDFAAEVAAATGQK